MKKTLIAGIIFLAFSTVSAFAQDIVEKTFPVKKGQRIFLELKFAENIKVSSGPAQEVKIKVSVLINEGLLNKAFVLKEINTEVLLKIKTDFDKELLSKTKGTASPCDNNRSFYSDDDIRICSEINFEIVVPQGSDLEIKTISGNIEMTNLSGSVYAKSISGFVDMSWPETKSATLTMKSITGEVFSDLPIEFTGKKEKHPMVGYQLEGTYKGGGAIVHLETISNNVYLRKK
jgi:hypothetical protein